ncbi:MAG TPA: hypothetical protein VLL76_06790 [Candidatus Omnitrophota bacterium]|nr:hypothetical protein [Candidatus Omnitrophota bacterium]
MLDLFEADALAAAGVVISTPGHPYPPMPAPPYRPVESRNWKFHARTFPILPGYFNGPMPVDWTTFLLVRDDVTWMSLVPAEVESQMPHLAAARGTVVVCGLGLGLMAYAVSALKAVDRLVVVERDREVAEMFHDYAQFSAWPQRSKVELVIEDARAFKKAGVDFLYADIWPFYRMDAMVEDMKAMHANIPAPACGYWGQEIDMVDFAVAQGIPVEEFGPEHVRAFASAHGLPLIGMENPNYPELCRRAAVNPAIGGKRIPIER